MPTHFHAIVFYQQIDPEALRATLIDFRKFTGRRLSEYCLAHMPGHFQEAFVGSAGKDRNHRFWQPTFHPEQIETEAFWAQKLDYLHKNRCRKGLVRRAEHWRFSSASWWLADHPEANDVVLTAIDW